MRGRIVAMAAAAALAVGLAVVPAPGRDSGAQAADLPSVSMEAVLKAAQIDPQRAGTGRTRGSGSAVLAVERALRSEGLLAGRYVDGHYGTATVTAWTRWQRRLGFSGLGANGIPGRASLTSLAQGRFTVTRVVLPGRRTTFGGATVDARTAAMLTEAERLLGLRIRLTQGSSSTSDPSSAGTHDGGGVVDIDVSRWDASRRVEVTRVLRRVGFAAWLRRPSEGPWPHHIHAVAVSDPDLSPPAQAQAGDYYLGRNGLRDDGPDTGPAVRPRRTWEEHRRAG